MSDFQDDNALDGIAIIAMAGRFPASPDLDAFWRNLREGIDCISRFSLEELLAEGVDAGVVRHPKYVRARGVLDGVELFDAAFFDVSPREAEIMDPQHRLFLETAWEALERAGYDPSRVPGPVGIFGGATLSSYMKHNLYSQPEILRAAGGYQIGLGNDKDYVTTRVSYKLDLRGPSVDVQTACSTSLVATVFACQALTGFQCDLALAGGASVRVPQKAGYVYSEGGLDSSDGYCRAFDKRADGSVYGSGVGVVVLRRLEDALRDGDQVLAVIRGGAINNDGSSKVGFTAPSVDGQSEVIATAQALAGVDPAEVDYVETHGTGTALGDPIEVAALTRAFAAGAEGRTLAAGTCAIGSVKTNIGHLSAASGMAGLIKTVLSLRHGEIPPSLHYEEPNPQIDFARTPFFVNDRLRPWPKNGRPRLAAVSSFGLGGTNAHVVLEEAPEPAPSGPSRPHQLLLLSARTATALESMTDRLADDLAAHPERNLADVAFTLESGRRVFDHRRMVVCRDTEDAHRALAERDPARSGPRRVFTLHQKTLRRPLVFLFSGLGDHYVGMGRRLYETEAVFRTELDRAAKLAAPELGRDLREVLFPADEPAAAAPAATDLRAMLGRSGGEPTAASRELDRTGVLQPALFAVEHALVRLLLGWGLQPEAVIGYSLGEYVAATVAGVLSFEDALRLVVERARLIEALPAGAMLAISLPRAEVEARLDSELDLAAVNGPHLTVVSGPSAAIERQTARFAEAGIASRRLPTTHAFHSRMMTPIAERLTERVRRITLRPPQIPLLSNLTGRFLTAEEATDPGYWSRHLLGTVEFSRGLEQLWQNPARVLLEIGPGQGLTSLALQHPGAETPPAGPGGNPPRTVLPTMHGRYESDDDQAFLLGTLGRLWLAGVTVDWRKVRGEEQRRRVALPTYPFERRRFWIEAGTAPAMGAGTGAETAGLKIPVWRRAAPRSSGETATPGSWLLLAGAEGLGARLGAELTRRGHEVVRIEAGRRFEWVGEGAFRVDPLRKEDFEAVLAQLPTAAWKVVHAWRLDGWPSTVDGLEPSGWAGLQALAGALGPRVRELEVRLLTARALAVGSGEIELASAALHGVFESLAGAFPEAPWSSFDVDPEARPEVVLHGLLGELLRPVRHGSAAWRGGERWERIYEPLVPGRGSRLRADAVVVVRAAQPGVPLELVRRLAIHGSPRVLLGGAAASTVAGLVRGALEAAGGEVAVAPGEDGWERLIAEADRRFGRVDGVVHVSLARGARLGELEHQLDELARALAGREPDFCMLLTDPNVEGGFDPLASSARAALLSAMAHRESRQTGVPWTSLTRHGEGSAEHVAEALGQLLTVEPVAHAALFGRAPAAGEPVQAQPARAIAARHARPELPTAWRAPAGEIEQALVAMWQEILGIEGIGADDSFFELGGHSLQGTVVLSRIRDRWRVELPLRALFEGPTAAELARAVIEAQVERTGQEEVADLLAQLEQMDDESAAKMLEEIS